MRQNTRASDSASEYREFAPAQALGGDILCLWEQRIVGSDCGYAHRVLPDGCIDIVLINAEEPMVVGPWTESFIAQFAPGTKIVGARFHPGRAMGLLGLPASELLNRRVPLREFGGAPAASHFPELRKKRILQRDGLHSTQLCCSAWRTPPLRTAR